MGQHARPGPPRTFRLRDLRDAVPPIGTLGVACVSAAAFAADMSTRTRLIIGGAGLVLLVIRGAQFVRWLVRRQLRVIHPEVGSYRVTWSWALIAVVVIGAAWGIPAVFGVVWPVRYGRLTMVPLVAVSLLVDRAVWKRRRASKCTGNYH